MNRTDITDAMVEAVGNEVGYHPNGWDCVDPKELIVAILTLDALDDARAIAHVEQQLGVTPATVEDWANLVVQARQLRALEEMAPIAIWRGTSGAAHPLGDGKRLVSISEMNPDGDELGRELACEQSLGAAIDAAVRRLADGGQGGRQR
jgi:hypothetical protein